MGIPIFHIGFFATQGGDGITNLRLTRAKAGRPVTAPPSGGDLDVVPQSAGWRLYALAGDAAADPAALLGVEDRLADPDRRRGHLDALVLVTELKRLL